MNTKALEVRDSGTFIPVIATRMWSPDEYEGYLLERSGFGDSMPPLVILCRMEAESIESYATYDPFSWRLNGTRTLFEAHRYIQANWDKLKTGDVVDVEFILGETKTPKISERLT